MFEFESLLDAGLYKNHFSGQRSIFQQVMGTGDTIPPIQNITAIKEYAINNDNYLFH